jgi:hypothetical protein
VSAVVSAVVALRRRSAVERTSPVTDIVSYRVSCAGCYSKLQVGIHHPSRGRAWMAAEERRQVELDGWTYLKDDYAICPECSPAMKARKGIANSVVDVSGRAMAQDIAASPTTRRRG